MLELKQACHDNATLYSTCNDSLPAPRMRRETLSTLIIFSSRLRRLWNYSPLLSPLPQMPEYIVLLSFSIHKFIVRFIPLSLLFSFFSFPPFVPLSFPLFSWLPPLPPPFPPPPPPFFLRHRKAHVHFFLQLPPTHLNLKNYLI